MRLGSGIAVAVAQASGYSFDQTPSLGTSICCKCGSKKTEKTKKKKKKKKSISSSHQETFQYPFIFTHCPPPDSLTINMRQMVIYFLFLQICFFCTFYTNEIISYMTFCIQLLSLIMVFSRLVCVAVCVSTSLFIVNISLCGLFSFLVYLLIS